MSGSRRTNETILRQYVAELFASIQAFLQDRACSHESVIRQENLGIYPRF